MKILRSSFIVMDYGSLLMTKPSFKEMSRAEHRAYVVATHDQEAIEELFVNRRNSNAKKYPPPLDEEGIRIMEEAIRQKVNDVKDK